MNTKELSKNNNMSRNQLTKRKLRFKEDRVKSYSTEASEEYKENNNNISSCVEENNKLVQQNYLHNCDLCELKRRNSIDLGDADSYIREKFKEIYLESFYGQNFQRQSTSLFDQTDFKKGKNNEEFRDRYTFKYSHSRIRVGHFREFFCILILEYLKKE